MTTTLLAALSAGAKTIFLWNSWISFFKCLNLDDILNINNVYFDNMVSQIYPSELQLNKANASYTEAAFLDLHLSISNDIVSTKIYDKRDFRFLDGDVPRSTSYGVYISQLIRFARAMLLTSTLSINC